MLKKEKSIIKKDKKKITSSTSDIIEQLVSEIKAKYKNHLCKNHEYLQRLDKRTMIQEI